MALRSRFAHILTLPERPEIIAVDIPIGLLACPCTGGRLCDRAARKLLGRARAASYSRHPCEGRWLLAIIAVPCVLTAAE